ncbi:MAG: UvrD-helicase domain-containing protein, partial [Verrucomicrobiota bacterium]
DFFQREAAMVTDGPLLIIAGPGTGKTRTFTHRIAHLVLERDVAPSQILAVTFTNRAAGEMRERLEQLLPTAAEQLTIKTFHGFGYSLLQEFAEPAGLPAGVRIATEPERLGLIEEVLDVPASNARSMANKLSRFRRCGEPELDVEYHQYADALRKRGWVDFDDLVELPLRLLEKDETIRQTCRRRYRWVGIDEYQDIDEWQYGLVRALVPPDGNLCAIGDPDQAIYGFRGGDVAYFQRFTEDFVNARTVHLENNYRSSGPIVDAAQQAVAPSSLVKNRRLRSLAEGDQRIVIHEAASDRAEAEFVVQSIERCIGGSSLFAFDSGRVDAGEADENCSFSDVAILYRTDAQAAVLSEALAQSGLPHRIHSHTSFLDQPGVQELLDALLAEDSNDSVSTRLNAMKSSEEDPPWRAGLERIAAECENNAEQFASRLALESDIDFWDPRADRIALMTLHASKGLEFPVVFVTGCEEGVLPLQWGGGLEPEALAEERRLFFVGMTRAQRRLYLTRAKSRLWRNTVREQSASSFLTAIQRDLIDIQRATARKPVAKKDEQLSLFE